MFDSTLKNDGSGFLISIQKCVLYTIRAPDNIFHSVRSNWATAEANCRDSNCLPEGLASCFPPSFSLPQHRPQSWQVKCSAQFSRAYGVCTKNHLQMKLLLKWNLLWLNFDALVLGINLANVNAVLFYYKGSCLNKSIWNQTKNVRSGAGVHRVHFLQRYPDWIHVYCRYMSSRCDL